MTTMAMATAARARAVPWRPARGLLGLWGATVAATSVLFLAEGIALQAVGALGMLAALVAALRAGGRFERRLAELDAFAAACAGGHFTARLTTPADDALTPLAEHLNAAARCIAQVLAELDGAGAELRNVSRETLADVAAGEAGVRSQRDITVSSAATLEQLITSLAATRDAAADAAQAAEGAAREAARGEAEAGAVAAAMGAVAADVDAAADVATALAERSRRIEGIAATIGGIAARTNLLALNAAIEAARAGEAGRGFAVVADEVRQLADGSAAATAEIGSLIQEVLAEVDRLARVIGDTRRSAGDSCARAQAAASLLATIRDAAGQTQLRIREIAEASAEQSIAGERIAGDVEQVARLADDNALRIGESGELARYQDELVGRLEERLGAYRYE
ncbi:methyl-accepting chemotaxis protein [Azoarcus olearius]|uniref:Methyl-accepting chemotaxis protein n=1 Tax=Azoarcus sp. (strain BH72) TaxID=418699 RepID=A1K410_AZOSB|nr:methyl-accepting chemotaxis protein [Azoarcus olearius]CAL93565.1 putative methyl-accepting chemotaxis protein [Azoarcus olearius]